MNYEEMSDFEINAAVASIVTDGDVIEKHNMANAPTEHGVQVIYKVGVHGEYFDYCNNPSDAWPIIVENEIDLTSPTSNGTEEWQAVKFTPTGLGSEISCYSANPIRAAMIVFLMMKENQNEQ